MKSIEEKLLGQLYCFCSGGDDDGGGSQDAQMDELDQIAADFANMSQQAAAGETVTSGMAGGVGRGGDSNDNDGDGIPNSIDATPGVDRSSIGAANYFDRAISDFGASPVDIFGPGTPAQDSRTPALGSPNDLRNAERQEALQAQQFGVANALQKMGIDPKSIGKTPLDRSGRIPDKMIGDEERGAFFGELDVLGAEEPDLLNLPPLVPGGKILSSIINTARAPVQSVQKAIDEGAVPVTDRFGFTVGATSPRGDVVYDIDPFSLDKSPEMQSAYDKMYQMREEERGDQQQVAAPVTALPVADPCPEGYKLNPQTNACEYVGAALPGVTPYTGQPITQTTQYTGIGSLNPFVLQPSYTAPRTFSPLFNAG